MQRLVLALLLLCLVFAAGFAAGRASPRPTPIATPVAESAPVPVALPLPDPACRSELVSTKAQLAICLAFRTPPPPAPPVPAPPTTAPEADEFTARLVRAHRTNTETVLVRRGRTLRAYRPGEWPPPDGVPEGARVVTRHVDGGTEHMGEDGSVEVVPDRPCPKVREDVPWNPCPKDDAGAAGAP